MRTAHSSLHNKIAVLRSYQGQNKNQYQLDVGSLILRFLKKKKPKKNERNGKFGNLPKRIDAKRKGHVFETLT